MQPRWINRTLLLLVMASLATLGFSQTQASESDYQAKRHKAIELFNENKNLEALPLLEDLATKKPRDDQILVALAACLLSHSATLEDEEAAIKERVRAREILRQAKDLGNTSTLMQNLLQLLPADGRISDSRGPVEKAFRKGEAAFARRDFEEAIKNYSRALELDPQNYSAALFMGYSYFAAKDWPKAGEWYERAIQINPNAETAYRYYADMLTRTGETEDARKRAIQAVVAEPYNPISWRGLEQWAKSNHLALNVVHLNVPRDSVSSKDDKSINITIDPNQPTDTMAVWVAYSAKRAIWRQQEFKKHFPQEKQYRHSLEEEAEALTAAAKVCTELVLSKADKEGASSRPKDPDLLHLVELYQANMIEPYVLLTAADEGIAQDYAAYREKNRQTLETYLSQFIVPPAPRN